MSIILIFLAFIPKYFAIFQIISSILKFINSIILNSFIILDYQLYLIISTHYLIIYQFLLLYLFCMNIA